MRIALALIASLAISSQASAAVFATQDFNSLSDADTFVANTFPVGSVQESLTNAGSEYAGGAAGIGFDTVWTDTRGANGPLNTDTESSSDFIGVNSFSGSNSPDVAADGAAVASGVEHNFEFNDGDGLLELLFDAVDSTGYSNVQVSLDYWVADTGFESDDLFEVSLTDGVNSATLVSLGEAGLEAAGTGDAGLASEWISLSFAVPSSWGASLSLVVGADTNSGSENIFVDNIVFEGDASAPVIPEPSMLLVFSGLAATAFARRRNG